MTYPQIIFKRLENHRLIDPMEDGDEYPDLFRLCQPVSTSYFARPGAPPTLARRTVFDDGEITSSLRRDRNIVKGRFLGGTIGYVFADDLAVYAQAFRKPLSGLNNIHLKILDALRSCGPIPPRIIKEETGLLNKKIMPALHRLQTACIVYEDQLDDDWERPWSLFEEDWPDIEFDESKRLDALARVLTRYFELNIFATLAQVRDWSQVSLKETREGIEKLVREGIIAPESIEELGEGYVFTGEARFTGSTTETAPDAAISADGLRNTPVRMLDRADPLVRSQLSELKERFKGMETLRYLLIHGELTGAVIGHWRIGPHDVDDIVVHISGDERQRLRERIIEEVALRYHPPHHHIRKYDGVTI